MSQSSTSTSTDGDADLSSKDVRTAIDEDADEALLDAFDDAYCRAILDATSERALSAKEISEACELPLSTTYRKLKQLTDADLLDERTRICRTGKHASEYRRVVEDVVVTLLLGWFFELAIAAFRAGTLFRGSLQSLPSERYGRLTPTVGQATVFSLVHLGSYPVSAWLPW
jgi:DNA-binding transcriptional ArsR family regulator